MSRQKPVLQQNSQSRFWEAGWISRKPTAMITFGSTCLDSNIQVYNSPERVLCGQCFYMMKNLNSVELGVLNRKWFCPHRTHLAKSRNTKTIPKGCHKERVCMCGCACLRALLATRSRPRMLLNTHQCTGQPPQHRIVSRHPKLRNPGLTGNLDTPVTGK